ncbi:hypothetical protein JR316_0011821 [Psilocybe cubensis]|uniref:Uncharacterized protein n=2 Tax=Psilocybe cubensis TaxID=181762 RepID=A0A8H8CEN8_PSICU|nr:hypothetical protein JR316_0011821 [Psilocybe cubensis]KAH9476250.1 hypothetical protein JR316_0011821 [Psilocybe cubensis]
MSSEAESQKYPELIRDTHSLQAYLEKLVDAYGWRPSEYMTELCVVKVSLMKNVKTKSRHESLLVELRDPNGGAHYLYFERARDVNDGKRSSSGPAQPPPDTEQLSAGPTPSYSPSVSSRKKNRRQKSLLRRQSELLLNQTISSLSTASSSASQSVSDSSMGTACDTVTCVPDGRRSGEKCMCRLEFEREGTGNVPGVLHARPSVYDIALIADILNKEVPRYHLFKSNCYHFAGLLYDTLNKLYNPSETILEKLNGKWKRFPLYAKDPEQTIASIIDQYRDARQQFHTKIENLHVARDKAKREAEERAQEADERARSEAHRADTEAQRADTEAQEKKEAKDLARSEAQRAESEAQRAESEAQQRRELEKRLQMEGNQKKEANYRALNETRLKQEERGRREEAERRAQNEARLREEEARRREEAERRAQNEARLREEEARRREEEARLREEAERRAQNEARLREEEARRREEADRRAQNEARLREQVEEELKRYKNMLKESPPGVKDSARMSIVLPTQPSGKPEQPNNKTQVNYCPTSSRVRESLKLGLPRLKNRALSSA